jgi:outer membrane protein TolC
MLRHFLIGLLLIFIQISAYSQVTEKVLTLKEFYAQIFEYHPIVKQSKLLTEMARQELRLSRGGFDPKLAFDYDQKKFDKKNYYSLIYSKLKIPTWIGELNATYERNEGQFVNPEDKISPGGLASVGVSIPIGRNLWMDERRSTLRQAQYFQQIAEAERVKSINKVLLSAAKDYWEWYFDYQQYILLQSGLKLADERYQAVRQRVRLGELAAIDSVQALITLQERQIQLQQGQVELQNARLMLSNYLWGENDTPLEAAENLAPENITDQVTTDAQLQELLVYAQENHPEIRKIIFKLRQLSVEERLQVNNLLPSLTVNYNAIQNWQNTTETTSLDFRNNYKLGINFEFPLLIRKERGKLQQVRVKQSQANFELIQTRREVQNSIQAAYNELQMLRQQLQLQASMVENYRILRDGELRRFFNGESSLFIINTQETKYIEAQIKLESQRSKYEKARAMLRWASGRAMWE